MEPRRRVVALTALVVSAAITAFASTATAGELAEPDPVEFTPEGYTFCGWRVLGTGDWKMEWDDSLSGAYLVAFAKGMTCRDARRNVTRVRTTQTPPYRPIRLGYRCKVLDNDYEYTDVRCTRIGASRKFRFQTGS
jgi:hypothetical protein